uniref:NADAR domain-containing protein n=1 Tax=Zooxanthella nutricula TaxID=1333877 RepID=A0A7S2IAJ0_9DINO
MGRKPGRRPESTRTHGCSDQVPSRQVSIEGRAAVPVICFYSDKVGRAHRELSNLFVDPAPFEFVLPVSARRDDLPHVVPCEFAEKAIMLARCALMGDVSAFGQIASASKPQLCRALGRSIKGLDQGLWERHAEEMAYEVARQRFVADSDLGALLLSTGEATLALASPQDGVLGTGVGLADDAAADPARWPGRNLFGKALMRVRGELHALRHHGPACAPSAGVAAPASPLPPLPGGENLLRPIGDLSAVRACYDQYGVVGVTGVLSAEECRRLICDGLEPCLPAGCSMDSPESFHLAGSAMNRYGVVGKNALFNPGMLAARVHPNVAAAFGAVHGREDVVAGHDRFAWMRPVLENPAWVTPFSWPGLHFDVSLRSYFGGSRSAVDEFLSDVDYASLNFVAENNAKRVSMGRTVQGVLSVFDNEVEDGGFHCVPGMFGPRVEEWARRHPGVPPPEANGNYELKDYGPDAKLGKLAVRVPCPAGTLILFDATLPHGTQPNASARSRAILFLRYLTHDELPAQAWQGRNAALRRIIAQSGFKPTAQQLRNLYGPE